MRRILALVLLVTAAASVPFVAVLSRADAAHAAPPEAALGHAAWLAGHWAGTTTKGQHVEEMWMPSRDGHMVGSFRWERGNGRWLFEFMALDEAPSQAGVVTSAGTSASTARVPRLRIKHFDREFRGMEEKDASTTLLATESSDRRLVFAHTDGARTIRVGYERTGPDTMRAWFDEIEPGKPQVHLEFPYTRVPSGTPR